jgi:carboxylesterase type B
MGTTSIPKKGYNISPTAHSRTPLNRQFALPAASFAGQVVGCQKCHNSSASPTFLHETVSFQVLQPFYCLQASSKTPDQAEDCLYLNIFAPATAFLESADTFPVMLWIHGGSWTSGGAA